MYQLSKSPDVEVKSKNTLFSKSDSGTTLKWFIKNAYHSSKVILVLLI